MGHLDPALGEVPGETEVLARIAARHAMGMRTGAADRGDDQVAGLETCDARTDLDDLADGFVAEHKILAVRRRCAVGEGADLAVGAANTDFDGFDPQLGRRAEAGRGVLEQGDLPLPRQDADGLHDGAVHRVRCMVSGETRRKTGGAI